MTEFPSSTDITERLRAPVYTNKHYAPGKEYTDPLRIEAADEIDRLRKHRDIAALAALIAHEETKQASEVTVKRWVRCSDCKAEWLEGGAGEIHQHTCPRISGAAQASGDAWNDAIEAAAKRAEAEPHDENEHAVITVSRCIALGVRALKRPTQGGDQGEAVAWWIFERNDTTGFFADRDPQHGKMIANAYWGENSWTRNPLYAAPQPASNAAMARLSASEAACYRWPEDTAEHRAMRAAYMDGAGHVAGDAYTAKDAYEVARHIIGYLEGNCGLSFTDVKQDDWDTVTRLVATLAMPSTPQNTGAK